MNMHAQSGSRKKVYIYTESVLNRLKRLVVVGDIHGDIDAFNSLLDHVDPPDDGIIFLGDYADRGPCGVEVIEGVKSLIDKYPQNVVALKGNHEDYLDGEPNFLPCTLIREVEEKRGSWDYYFKNELKPFLDRLYLAAIIPSRFLFVHGGISSKITSLEDFENPAVEEDVLWSDPFEGLGEYPNSRGAGVEFGKDVTEEVCKNLGVGQIIRSHQPNIALDGPFYHHDRAIVTVSSTGIYGGKPFIYIIDLHSPITLYKFL
jgi:hypothetical protein